MRWAATQGGPYEMVSGCGPEPGRRRYEVIGTAGAG